MESTDSRGGLRNGGRQRIGGRRRDGAVKAAVDAMKARSRLRRERAFIIGRG